MGEAPRRSHRPFRRKFGFSAVKRGLTRVLHGAATRLPPAISRFFLRIAQLAVRAFCWVPGNPLRRAASQMCALAARHGHRHEPGAILRRQTDQARFVGDLYLKLFHEGPEAVLPWLEMPPDQRAELKRLREEHGSYVIAVPHNFAAVVYALRLSEVLPTLVISKRSRSPAVTDLYRTGFELMGIDSILSHRTIAFELNRRVVRAIADGQVLVITVDRIRPREDAMEIAIFGERVRFNPWAVNIAVRRRIPVLPVYVSVENGEGRLQLGESLLTEDPVEALQHIMSYFEGHILADPGSWAFLSDKHWSRVLRRAAGRTEAVMLPSSEPARAQ